MSEAVLTKAALRSERVPGRNYDLFQGADEAHIFTEGNAGGAFGPSICRLEFFRITNIEPQDDGENLEIRERNLILTMPTAQLVEFLTKSLQSLRDNKLTISAALDDQTKKMLAALD